MTRSAPVRFTFTELLYGVVIGTAITRIEALALTEDTVLMIVALLLVCDDYLLYHHEIEMIEGTGRNAVVLFMCDMVVLAAWYSLALASTYGLSVFFLCVAIFFTATSAWEWLFSRGPILRRVFLNADFPLVLTAGALALVGRWADWPLWVFLGGFGVVFVVWRARNWRQLWQSE